MEHCYITRKKVRPKGVKFKKVKEIIDKIFKYAKSISREFFSFLDSVAPVNYRERIEKSFGIDPFRCPKCGDEMILYEVWHPKQGIIYSIFRDENWRDYVVEEEGVREQRLPQQDNQLSLFKMSLSNQCA